MMFRWNQRVSLVRVLVLVLAIVGAVWSAGGRWQASAATPHLQTPRPTSEPWTGTEAVEPAALVKELAGPSTASRPTVVCVGVPSLYRGGHVPGALFHGPASSPEGLADLKRWAQHVSRTTHVVLYCGCCPFAECPNVRPAFTALHDMGFKNVRVLMLPSNFATDWVGKGYPVER
jgi:thiosulfate/3-mercaptopyruvate sulfurtransferase